MDDPPVVGVRRNLDDFVEYRKVPIEERAKLSAYPFAEMEVGDSFFVPVDEGGRLKAAARRWGGELGFHFSIKRTTGGWRLWRVY